MTRPELAMSEMQRAFVDRLSRRFSFSRAFIRRA